MDATASPDSAPPPARSAPPPPRGAPTAALALMGAALGGACYAAVLRSEIMRLEPELAAGLGFACVGGLTLMLLMREGFGFWKLCAAVGWGALWAAPFGWVFLRGMEFDFAGRDSTLPAAATASVFLFAPFLAGEFAYRKLMARMCDNILAAGAGISIAGISFLLIHLGAELFSILGIDTFKEWVEMRVFRWLFFPMMFGAGLSLPVWRLRRLALMIFRLPSLFGAVVALAFAAALALAGPEPLWERNIAAPLLLTLTALMLLFTAAVFGEGGGARKGESDEEAEEAGVGAGNWTRRVLSLTLLVLPVFSGLALWGIFLRIEQYGLTPARIWGAYAGAFLLLAALIYGACGLFSLLFMRHERGKWLGGLRLMNPILAFVAAGILYFSHTPIMDPWRWSLESQLTRAMNVTTDPENIDLPVFYRYGGYGAEGLDKLEARLRNEDSIRAKGILAEIEKLSAANDAGELESLLAAQGWENAPVYGKAAAGTAIDIVRAMKAERPHMDLSCPPSGECAHLALDLTADGWTEHCLIRKSPDYAWMDCFIREGGGFKRMGGLAPRMAGTEKLSNKLLMDNLRDGKWESTPAAVNDVVIGGRVYFLVPDADAR